MMVSGAVALTDAKLKGLKPTAEGQAEISDSKVPGLRVRIGKTGVRTFIVRKRVGGRLRNITIGRFGPRLTLADARRKARAIISDIEAGHDPAKSKSDSGLTISALWTDYVRAKKHLRSIAEIKRVGNRHILPQFGDRMADGITRGEITRFINEIAATAPFMARAVHAQLSAFYTWAMPSLDRLVANPCRDAGRPSKPKSRDRVLTEEEIRALWLATADLAPNWRAGVRLLLTTGQRRDEVFSADRAEFDFAEAIWTIPADRAKNDLAHIVPLSGPALEIAEGVPELEGSDKLFPSRTNPETGPSGFSKMMKALRAALDKHLGRQAEHWTLHDLRRTVATGLQRLGIRFEVTEAVLNHVSGAKGGIAGVYQRHEWRDEKRHALEAWAAEVDRILHNRERDNVVAING